MDVTSTLPHGRRVVSNQANMTQKGPKTATELPNTTDSLTISSRNLIYKPADLGSFPTIPQESADIHARLAVVQRNGAPDLGLLDASCNHLLS
jgi:hypothetical protein